jgi:Ca2+-binding EF-hand superfamily protein
MFNSFDQSNDGIVNKKEFTQAMQRIYGQTLNLKEIERIFKLCDKNGNGRVSYSEFQVVMADRESLINRDKVDELFKILDKVKENIPIFFLKNFVVNFI